MNNNFCVWRYVTRNGKPTKVPYNPITEHRGKSNDPSTFSTLSDAQDAICRHPHNYDGIGIGIFPDPDRDAMAAVDIDGCVSSENKFSDTATQIISMLNKQIYVEYSPSGTGIHILFTVPAGFFYDKTVYYIKSPKSHVEVYVPGMTNRFLTYTGKRISGDIDDLPDCSAELLAVLDAFMKRHHNTDTTNTDAVLQTALKNQKFFKLFNGNISEYGSHSEADLALCDMLAWWTNGNADEIDRLFRQSSLMREKWLRDDYRNSTIEKAISSFGRKPDRKPATQNFYEPIFHKLHSQTMNMGRWNISERGISYTTPKNHDEVFVSATPIIPAAYIENADTGVHKTELHFLYNHTYRTAIFNNDVLASRNKVVELSNVGIDVTTTTAREFVDYIQEIFSMNADKIPHAVSVSRLGWITLASSANNNNNNNTNNNNNNKSFMPYDTEIIFDGEAENRALFRAVSPSGTLDAWIAAIRPLRSNLILRLTMAASFASPLIELCGALPFIFHLWGKTGTGKTVALMVAMSIWGNPRLGKLTYTMNMTDNALMTTAGGLYSIPFAGDELQLIKSTFGYDRLIMRVTEGIERGRMNYNEKLPQRVWKNAFIFTGEEPCTSDHSGAGAKNRVIEIPVSNTVVVENGPEVVSAVETNYGVAGYHYIDFVKSHPPETLYDGFYRELCETCDSTGKQAMAAALILTGDELARQAFFPDEPPLTLDNIMPFMKSDVEVDISARAAEYISEWIVVNKLYFEVVNELYFKEDSRNHQIYGRIEGQSVYIINSVLKNTLRNAGFEFDAVKEGWENMAFLIRSPTGKYSISTRISGSVTRCIHLELSTDD
ncbi:MAG: DUF927 domain-containing protein [Clostridia bacterium]|nr:DUF927 domain-containing protein [Clostridia bacterium]